MPAKRKPLGFVCPDCGCIYGSIVYLPPMKTKERNKMVTDEVEHIYKRHFPKRSTLKPVEYSLINAIIAEAEEDLLEQAEKHVSVLKRNSWCLFSWSLPMPEEEKKKFENYVLRLKSIVEERKRKYLEEKGQNYSRWDVTERMGDDVSPDLCEIMRSLSDDVTLEVNNTEEGDQQIIRWNPVIIIKKYRRMIDPFYHIDLYTDFYWKVLVKNPSFIEKLIEMRETLENAFNIINNYRKQCYNRNWRYTWLEWFWIVRYAQSYAPKKAVKMLIELDGEKEKVSTRYIKDRMEQVMRFWHDFFKYRPYLIRFINLMDNLIKNNPELKKEYEIMLREDEQKHQLDREKIKDEHMKNLNKILLSDEDYTFQRINDYSLQLSQDDFKRNKLNTERIRIFHPIPKDKKTQDLRKTLRRDEQKPKKSCTIQLEKLPIEIRVKLMQEGKIPPL